MGEELRGAGESVVRGLAVRPEGSVMRNEMGMCEEERDDSLFDEPDRVRGIDELIEVVDAGRLGASVEEPGSERGDWVGVRSPSSWTTGTNEDPAEDTETEDVGGVQASH